MFHFISVITDIQLNDFKTISKVPYKGNYKWVWNQLRLSADHKVCGVLDPRKVSKSLGGETHRRDPCQALPPCLPIHLLSVIQAIPPGQQNLLHFGYVACTGSFVDLSEVLVSDAVPGLEVDFMTAVSHWVDGGAKGRDALFNSWSQNSSSSQSLQTPTHLTSPSALQSPLNPTQTLRGKPEQSCHNLPTGKLNSLESFIPEWSLLSDT